MLAQHNPLALVCVLFVLAATRSQARSAVLAAAHAPFAN
jgi:hypothetical protein